MDIEQFKLLAGRARGLLEQHNVVISHAQSLDLSSALVGLRNWPEVMAFQDRVKKFSLNEAGTARLSHRIHRKHGIEMSSAELLQLLLPPENRSDDSLPDIWPTGPKGGVYIALDADSIFELAERFEEETDGALILSELSLGQSDTVVSLPEYGIHDCSARGIPSGTLIVLGPVELTESNWHDFRSKLMTACIVAEERQHRIAILVNTQSPDAVLHDTALALRLESPEHADVLSELLRGTVSENGELVEHKPFFDPLPVTQQAPCVAPSDLVPETILARLAGAVAYRNGKGILALGSSLNEGMKARGRDSDGVDHSLLCAVLAATNSLGPAARIHTRRRSTPSKDWDVPEAIRDLPYLSSIDAAYERGFRRIFVTRGHALSGDVLKYADKVLFISSYYGDSVDDILSMGGSSYIKDQDAIAFMSSLIGVMATSESSELKTHFVDAYLAQEAPRIEWKPDYFDSLELLLGGRTSRIEEQIGELLDSGVTTPQQITELFSRCRTVRALLQARREASKQMKSPA